MPSISPELIAGVAAAASVAGTATAAIGQAKSASAAANAANYNAQVSKENQTIATQNATWATQAGEQQAEQSQLKTRATVGAIEANQAAGNIDVNSGSAVDVRSSAAELGELDAINIRANAAREAYGYESQAASYGSQSQLDQYEAENDITAGQFGEATTLLGGVGSAASNWARFQQSASMNPNPAPTTYGP